VNRLMRVTLEAQRWGTLSVARANAHPYAPPL
jgi:hypothetical protein